MTLYLWYSDEAESAAQQRQRERPSSLGFGSFANRNKLGFCIYLDDDGDPVRVTSVGNDAEPPSAHKDLRLVGVSEKANCLVSNTGFFDDAARDWCVEHDITPSLNGLLQYMGSGKAPLRTHTKKPVTVGRAIRLKK